MSERDPRVVKLRREFREHLNALPGGMWRGRNNATGRELGNRSRKYGDYLYAQDRDKFETDFQEWLVHRADYRAGKEQGEEKRG